ncbi:MAG TPA: DUF5058 family protein [Bacillota bacterium]|nr:DUF5058 family protein [Bacillota bacterium]
MSEVLSVANSWPLWIIAIVVMSLVYFQSIKFMLLGSKAGESVGMTKKDVRAAIRTGAYSSLGPSFAIVVVAISLISILGNPVTLVRIGIIGSAPVEAVGATVGAEAAGSQLGGADYTSIAFTAAVWVMCLGGIGWLLVTAIFTKSLGKIQAKATNTQVKLERFKMISTGAMIGVFGYLGAKQMVVGITESLVLVVAAIVMPILIVVANKYKLGWLKEWSLGIVCLVGIIFGYYMS